MFAFLHCLSLNKKLSSYQFHPKIYKNNNIANFVYYGKTQLKLSYLLFQFAQQLDSLG